MRQGGFYSAVARYGADIWVPFVYSGVHSSERSLRRKHAHRLWNVNGYSSAEDVVFRTTNRLFHEPPGSEVQPSAVVVIAADRWAGELARETLPDDVPLLVSTPDGEGERLLTTRRSGDHISDPPTRFHLGWPERTARWLRTRRDLSAILNPDGYELFLTVAEFPGMETDSLADVVGSSVREAGLLLDGFAEVGLVTAFGGRWYLIERGMRRAANLCRILPAVIRSRHGAFLKRPFRERERAHNDAINRIVRQFALEGVRAVAGWRAEINLPDITQVRSDLLILARDGPFGGGPYWIEYERQRQFRSYVRRKLSPYRRVSARGSPLPLLIVCKEEATVAAFEAARGQLPMLVTTEAAALDGRLTGGSTVWTWNGAPAAIHC